jgi:ubiquinone/menaquinone biosynthesis C-methylase UbiE
MLRRATEINRHAERCRYVLNESDDLRRFDDCTFDFIYSNITLQHMRPVYIRRYIREFVRVLKPGGVALFQVPSALVKKPGAVRRAIGAVLAKVISVLPSGSPKMEMHGVERQAVIEILESAGAMVVEVIQDGAPGPDWYSHRYCARKR